MLYFENEATGKRIKRHTSGLIYRRLRALEVTCAEQDTHTHTQSAHTPTSRNWRAGNSVSQDPLITFSSL